MKAYRSILVIITTMLISCEPQKDYVLCSNGKIEKNGECECPAGYAGDNCDVPLRDNLLGRYKGTLTWNDTGNYNNNIVRIDTIRSSKAEVAVSIYSNKLTRSYACKIVDSNHFVFESKGVLLIDGTMSNNVLQVTEQRDHEGDLSKHNGTYKYIGVKQ